MTVPTITLYSGVIPNRANQSPEDFTSAAITWTDYQAVTLVPSINTTVGAINATATQINADKLSAATSAETAQTAANMSVASANFKGLWENLTGALSIPASVGHVGSIWFLIENTTNVTLDEPGVSAKWEKFIAGWENVTTTATAQPNAPLCVDTSTAVDVSIYTSFNIGDEFSIANAATSMADVRILNPSYTITGSIGSVTSGNNILLKKGQTLRMQAKSLTHFVVV